MTESTLRGLEFLISRRGYAAWGLVFDRQSVYDAGGGPVWYVRSEQHQVVADVSPRVRTWLVRLEPGQSDWLEEREWRIPLSPDVAGMPAIPLEVVCPIALLVADRHWLPVRDNWVVSPLTGEYEIGPSIPRLTVGLPRWWWDAADGKLYSLPPFTG